MKVYIQHSFFAHINTWKNICELIILSIDNGVLINRTLFHQLNLEIEASNNWINEPWINLVLSHIKLKLQAYFGIQAPRIVLPGYMQIEMIIMISILCRLYLWASIRMVDYEGLWQPSCGASWLRQHRIFQCNWQVPCKSRQKGNCQGKSSLVTVQVFLLYKWEELALMQGLSCLPIPFHLGVQFINSINWKKNQSGNNKYLCIIFC